MAAGRVRYGVPLLVLALIAPLGSGQALLTGETGGRGASSIFVAANASYVRDFTTASNLWAAYTRGVHDHVDAFGFYGALTIFGQTQHYAGVGSNLGIFKRTRHGLDVAFLNFFAKPFNHRDQAATVSATFALIGSRPFRLRGREFTMYTGYLRSEFFGRRAGKLFTPASGTHNGIVGTVFPLSGSLWVVAEYDAGRSQQNVGMALSYVLPKK